MNRKPYILILFSCLLCFGGFSQNNTFSPYSRYGLGELNQPTFAHNVGVGGAYIALMPDSGETRNISAMFINAGNPAAYSRIKFSTLEVGAGGVYSQFSGSNGSLTKWSTNFSYGALGFPIRGNGGACLGIMPYSNVGYDLKNNADETGIGAINYQYSGTGGLNKAFIGYGVMPFIKRMTKFRKRNLFVPDSLRTLRGNNYKFASIGNQLLSDFSIGANVNYIFGSLSNTTRVVYPNSLLYNNTFRERNLTLGDFTGNFGIQTAVTFDSTRAKIKKTERLKTRALMDSIKASGLYTGTMLQHVLDSIQARHQVKRRAMNEKVKITFGYFMTLNNALSASYNTMVYNYILNGSGQEIVRDTVLYKLNQESSIKLPLEQGFGIGFKKGERINAVADFAITNWSGFRYLGSTSSLKNNYRVAAGVNFVPEKYAAGSGAFIRRINYRFGVSYQTGYIELKNTLLTNYALTAGLGLPVGLGRMSSMINLSVQVGQMGSANNNLIKENYMKFTVGFTFSDRWFQKYMLD